MLGWSPCFPVLARVYCHTQWGLAIIRFFLWSCDGTRRDRHGSGEPRDADLGKDHRRINHLYVP